MARTSTPRRKPPSKEDGDFTLDDLDRAILYELLKDARTPILQIARKLGRRPSTCRDRLTKMEEMGYIERYTVILNLSNTRLRNFKYLLIRAVQQNDNTIEQLGNWIGSLRGVIMCDKIEGTRDILAKIGFFDNGEGRSIQKEIASHPLCRDAITLTCIESFRHYEIGIDQLM